MLISHIGIAVKNLDNAVEQYSLLLGAEPAGIEVVPDQQVRVAMFDLGNRTSGEFPSRIELLEATSEDSPLARSIAKRGEGLHHICLIVEDLETKLKELESAGIQLIDRTPREGALAG